MFSYSKVTDDTKITYDAMSNESNSSQITSLAVPYQVPMYSVIAQDASLQRNVVSNMISGKQSNVGDFSGKIF